MTLPNMVRRASAMVRCDADSEIIGVWRFNETNEQSDKSRRCTISGVANFFEVPALLSGRKNTFGAQKRRDQAAAGR